MALLIDKNLTVLGDIDLAQLYVRLTISYGPGGTSLIVRSDPYASKVAYDADSNNNIFPVIGINSLQQLAYDRVADGSDILTFVHDKIKTNLSTDITQEEPLPDPSTGEEQIDPSTGEIIMHTVIITPKFAQDSSISIVDL